MILLRVLSGLLKGCQGCANEGRSFNHCPDNGCAGLGTTDSALSQSTVIVRRRWLDGINLSALDEVDSYPETG